VCSSAGTQLPAQLARLLRQSFEQEAFAHASVTNGDLSDALKMDSKTLHVLRLREQLEKLGTPQTNASVCKGCTGCKACTGCHA
jgi:hypothetical protein